MNTLCGKPSGDEPKCKSRRIDRWSDTSRLWALTLRILIVSVHKSSRPQWTTTFPLTYEFGSECYFFVRVFRLVHATGGSRSSKGPGDDTNDDQEGESLGDAVFEIGDILGSKHHTKIRRLPKGGV